MSKGKRVEFSADIRELEPDEVSSALPQRQNEAPKLPTELRGDARREALRDLPRIKASERLTPQDLPVWVRGALTKIEVNGLTHEEACAEYRKSPATLLNYLSSPAAKEWRAAIRDMMADPVEVAKGLLKSSALGVTLEALAALEAAKAADDYKEQGVIARDLMDRIPGLDKKSNAGAGENAKPTIVINLGAGVTLEAPTAQSSYEEQIEEAEWEMDEQE